MAAHFTGEQRALAHRLREIAKQNGSCSPGHVTVVLAVLSARAAICLWSPRDERLTLNEIIALTP